MPVNRHFDEVHVPTSSSNESATAPAEALRALTEIGQSVWLDSLSRALVSSGELARLRDAGVAGLTSNPSIFHAAIAGSEEYDGALDALRRRGATPEEALEALMVEDVQAACDVLAPVHWRTAGVDGWVSLEVDPRLADDVTGTVAAARRLVREVARANLMVKVPATPAGMSAIEQLLAEGVSVNATLVFDVATADAVAEAHARAARRRVAGPPSSAPQSVVSVFVSRLDSLLDPRLPAALRGRAGIANARAALAAARRRRATGDGDACALERQRLLWASTGVKDARPALAYVTALAAAETVTTLPPATLDALLAADSTAIDGAAPPDDHAAVLGQLAAAGIDLHRATAKLQRDGVEQFRDAYLALLDDVAARIWRRPA